MPVLSTDDDVLDHILGVLKKTVPKNRNNPFPHFFQNWPIDHVGDIFEIDLEDIPDYIPKWDFDKNVKEVNKEGYMC
jgi:hypothetical protein